LQQVQQAARHPFQRAEILDEILKIPTIFNLGAVSITSSDPSAYSVVPRRAGVLQPTGYDSRSDGFMRRLFGAALLMLLACAAFPQAQMLQATSWEPLKTQALRLCRTA
jgi:hypothetical protein